MLAKGRGTVDEGSVGRVARRVRGKLAFGVTVTVAVTLDSRARSQSQEEKVRSVHFPAQLVECWLNGMREGSREGLSANVRVGGVGPRGQLCLEAPPVGSVAQISSRTRGRSSNHAQVHRRSGPHPLHKPTPTRRGE